jgi:DNA-binding NtrC family response regulator
LSRDPVVGALLGAAVELAGFLPTFADAGETPTAAIRRSGAAIALVDAGREATEGDTIARDLLSEGARPILVAPRESAIALAARASRLGTPSFTVPVDHAELVEVLRSAQ